MSINVSNLILKLQEKIAGTENEELLLYYAKALQQLRSGTVNTVNSFSDLPSASENTGKLFLVKGDATVYFASFDGFWVDINEKYSQLYAWGLGTYGRLGDGTIECRCSPVQEISSSTNWYQVSAGCCHSSAVKTDGTLWSWGSGSNGVIGDGTITDKCSPVQEISSSTNWCQVSAGDRASVAIKTDGTIWSWGFNTSGGRLGDGTTTDKCSPVQEFCSSTNWCQVSAGRFHSSAIKTDGTLWSWGRGYVGILGDGTTTSKCSPVQEFSSSTNWCQVSAGWCHSSAVKTDGTLWSWGRGYVGILGDGTTTDKCSPVQEISLSTNWCQVSAALSHSSAIKTDGTIWSWGCGNNGRLGDGTFTNKCSPVQEISLSTNWCQVSAAPSHSSAIKTDATIWGWGNNYCGKLGNGSTSASTSPVQVILSQPWCQVSAADHVLAIAFTET